MLLCFLICIAAFSRQACLFFSFDWKHNKLAVTLAGQVFYLHHLIHKDERERNFIQTFVQISKNDKIPFFCSEIFLFSSFFFNSIWTERFMWKSQPSAFRVRKMSFQCLSDQIIKKIVINIIILKLIINHVAYMKLSINRWCQYYINGNIFIQFKSVLMFLF